MFHTTTTGIDDKHNIFSWNNGTYLYYTINGSAEDVKIKDVGRGLMTNGKSLLLTDDYNPTKIKMYKIKCTK